LLHYAPSNIPVEASTLHSASHSQSKGSISDNGPYAIEFRDVSLRYRPGLPLSLAHASFSIRPGERIGIVGRTGAGKSTILSALLRLTELEHIGISPPTDNHAETPLASDPSASGIFLYGKNIQTIPLDQLRGSHLTVILQDAVFLRTSIRNNLDPLHRHTDATLWRILELVSLKDFILSLQHSASILPLDAIMSTSGEPFSLGQRQLLALARALLKMMPSESHLNDFNIAIHDNHAANSNDELINASLRHPESIVNEKTEEMAFAPILVMDEATANIDMVTDALIQKTLGTIHTATTSSTKSQLPWTILTIAHRIATIMDYDRVIVMDKGSVAEIGPPRELANNPDSLFYSLVHI
jgi:ATP-binding cassette, subfamily C (CFTR/MRP), member 1